MIFKISIGFLVIVLSIYSAHSEEKACIALYDPVCGSDGKTYGNGCEAANKNVSFVKGECPKICPFIYDPVCADGIEFPNSCVAESAGYSNSTEGGCICTEEYVPVCGKNGKTYGNKCEARRENQINYTNGPCPNGGQNVCTEEYRPVCASCKTYSNECVARNAGETKIVPGFCPCSRKGYARNCPVCADGTREYRNKCFARDAGELSFENGPCPKV